MTGKKVAIVGATGLIGASIIQQFQSAESIVAFTRTPIKNLPQNVKNVVVDFSDWEFIEQQMVGTEIAFSCMGTTYNQVKGDMQLYHRVDVEIPLQFAQIAHKVGVKHFLLVSSIGTSAKAKGFYLKMKWELEDAIAQIGFQAFSIFRPSLLMGQRKEFRLGERIFQYLMGPLAFLIPGAYKPIQAKDVALAMIHKSLEKAHGQQILHYKEIKALI
jgi:uncharacterized protein YbjT (DUF2867 family)